MIDKKIADLKIGIMGVGMVGGATKKYFEKVGRTPLVFDKGTGEGSLEQVNQADVIFICVPTPYLVAESGFDLSYVREACSKIEESKVVVIKSTVVPGTTEKLQTEFPQHKFLFNPEFLTELTADQDMSYPDRQIVGYTKESFTVAFW
ncbi:MAG: hypothetical protein NTV62_00475 [Candidatus Gribaldobacteria bacterium]|nr:hypothetical protein [Candidatus Gribaldobacteria bacterium]